MSCRPYHALPYLTKPVLDGDGRLGDCISLPNSASTGKRGRRKILMARALREALADLMHSLGGVDPPATVIFSERGGSYSASTIATWFWKTYEWIGMDGCYSHSGRRTFITRCARRISTVYGSMRDVQALASHADLATTQRHIESDSGARRKLVGFV